MYKNIHKLLFCGQNYFYKILKMLGKYSENISAICNNIAFCHGLWTAKIASKYFCHCTWINTAYICHSLNFHMLAQHKKMTACHLALGRSNMVDHNPTSHSFTYVLENKLLLRFIYYLKHSLYKNDIFSKAVVSCTHLNCCYFAVSLHSFHNFSANNINSMFNAYQLHRTNFEGYKVLVKCERMLQLTITWLPIFSEFLL
jgi:hypothetical protein